MRNMVFDKRKDKSFNTIHNHKNNMSRPSKKCNNLRQLNKATVKDNNDGAVHVGNRFDYLSWSLSADEDFIVFCFGEDGAFNVVKDNEGVLRKRSIVNQQDQDCIITPSKEGEGKEGRQQHRDIKECAESWDSDQSEGSTGSFAFPVLGCEWIGSPVQMPKPEGGQQLKKQKARSVRFQGCRF